MLTKLKFELDIPIILTINLADKFKFKQLNRYSLYDLVDAGIHPDDANIVLYCENSYDTYNTFTEQVLKNNGCVTLNKFKYIFDNNSLKLTEK